MGEEAKIAGEIRWREREREERFGQVKNQGKHYKEDRLCLSVSSFTKPNFICTII